MNDWWNDPSEQDEGPACPVCYRTEGGHGDYLTGNQHIQMYGCDCCGHRWLLDISGEDPAPEHFVWAEATEALDLCSD